MAPVRDIRTAKLNTSVDLQRYPRNAHRLSSPELATSLTLIPMSVCCCYFVLHNFAMFFPVVFFFFCVCVVVKPRVAQLAAAVFISTALSRALQRWLC